MKDGRVLESWLQKGGKWEVVVRGGGGSRATGNDGGIVAACVCGAIAFLFPAMLKWAGPDLPFPCSPLRPTNLTIQCLSRPAALPMQQLGLAI